MQNSLVSSSLFAVFSDDERHLLKRVAEHYPQIIERITKYLGLPANYRYQAAMLDAKNLARTGWVRREVKDPENVDIHSRHVSRKARDQLPDELVEHYRAKQYPQLSFEEVRKALRARTDCMCRFHDYAEVIIGDFTPGDNFDPDVKLKLEKMASRVIFAEGTWFGFLRAFADEYAEQKTLLSHWVHDIDKLDPCYVALQIEARTPEKMGIYREFADYVARKLKTSWGREIFADLEENHTAYRDDYREKFRSGFFEKQDFENFLKRVQATLDDKGDRTVASSR